MSDDFGLSSPTSNGPPSRQTDGDSKWETGQVHPDLRAEVLARDGGVCRFCGAAAENPALHHIRYRSEGGLNVVENLITIHWMYEPRCHERMHSNKGRFQPIALQVVKTPGVTMLQLERWQKRGGRML
jgi:hypothetical protein